MLFMSCMGYPRPPVSGFFPNHFRSNELEDRADTQSQLIPRNLNSINSKFVQFPMGAKKGTLALKIRVPVTILELFYYKDKVQKVLSYIYSKKPKISLPLFKILTPKVEGSSLIKCWVTNWTEAQ